MKKQTPEEREADARMLAAARTSYETMRVALEATVVRLQEHEDVDEKDVKSSIKAFRDSIQSVINIEADLAKRSYEQRSGGEGACPLDLAAARREVIERLTKRANARGSGGVS